MADEFTVKQASYLWHKDNTKELIDSLSKNNAFITKNESGVYRYHHMLLQCTRQKFCEKTGDNSFSDVADDKYYVNAEGLIQGDGNRLTPTGNTTRAQAAAILNRLVEEIAR